MNEIKVEVMFTDGYQKRYTEAVAKAYQKKNHRKMVEAKQRNPRSHTSDSHRNRPDHAYTD